MKNKLGILVVSLIMLSCATTQKSYTSSSQSSTHDTIIYKEIVHVDTFRVNADSTKIIISPYLLKDTVWNYIEKTDGRSRLVVQRLKDTIYVNAYCDSVIKLILNTEKTLYKLRSNSQISTDKTLLKKSNFFAKRFTAMIVIALILIVIVYVFIKKL